MEQYPLAGNTEVIATLGEKIASAEAHIGWHEAMSEIMYEPEGIEFGKLGVDPKTGTIMPKYYLPKEGIK